jgi:hypothetical protein
VVHWEKFLEFEQTNDLFSLEEDGLPTWDMVRYLVYLDYMWDNFQEQRHKPRKLALVSSQLRRLRSLVAFLFRKPQPNLFFINSRDRLPDGRYYDRNANDFLQRMAGESHILENFENPEGKYLYPVSLFNFAYIFKRIYYLFYRLRDYSGLAEKINGELGLHWDNERINKVVGHFRGERLFYKWLFRFKRTKRVYVTFAVPKALYCAARECGVESLEFQHGIIDRGHIAYNYPAAIADQKRVYCPDVLLTFSDFWCQDTHYPVGRIVPIGNTILADVETTDKTFDPKNLVMGFISADVFGQSLAELALEYIRLHPQDHIFFKLHPNQFSRRKEYYKLFHDYPNIKVVTNEQPTERMVASCDAIVLIQSTIAYEALQAGIPVFIYKRMTYYRHDHIFNSPNVRLIDDARQIVLTGKPPQPGPRDVFFDDFDERVYRLLSEGESPTRTHR